MRGFKYIHSTGCYSMRVPAAKIEMEDSDMYLAMVADWRSGEIVSYSAVVSLRTS